MARKRKYGGMYYSIEKKPKGWIWKIFFGYWDKKASQTSLNNGVFDKYTETSGEAVCNATEAIQDHYD